jgi:hypothetical protein
MPALTRRPNYDPHRTGWHVYYGDVHVGSIGKRAGVPVSAPQWQWSCGFYPGMEPGQQRRCRKLRGLARGLRKRVAENPANSDRGRIFGMA